MRTVVVSIYIVLLAVLQGVAQPVEFTLEDRDRIIRAEVRLEELQKQMELQYNDVQRQFDDLWLDKLLNRLKSGASCRNCIRLAGFPHHIPPRKT